MAERLALPTSDHRVSGSNPAEGESLSNLNDASLRRAFHVHPFIVLKWLNYCCKGRKNRRSSIQPSKIPRRLRAQLSRNTIKSTQWHVQPADYITSLGIREVWSIDPWLPIKRTAMTDQTGRMLRLILFLSGCSDHLVDLSCSTTKPTKWPVRPAKTQVSLGIRPVW